MNVEKLIKEYIKKAFKLFKDDSKNLYEEIFEYCYKIYLENLSKGFNEEKSLNDAFYKVNVKYIFKLKSKKINYLFPLIISIISLIFSLILYCFEQFMYYFNYLFLLGILIFFIFLIHLSFFVYSIKTIKIRSKFELIISLVLLVGCSVLLIESFIYFYSIPNDDIAYSLYTNLRGTILYFYIYNKNSSVNALEIILIDPTIICSISCLISSLIYYSIKINKLTKYNN